MKVYLDNNILIEYEKGNISLLPKKDTEFYYSYVHILELLECEPLLLLDRIKRLATITRLTQNRFITLDDSNSGPTLIEEIEDPKHLFDVMNMPPLRKIQGIINQQLVIDKWCPNKDPDFFIRLFGINKKAINNMTDEKFIKEHEDKILIFLILTSENEMEFFISMFNIIDTLGYWRDRLTHKSTRARTYDAMHSYFASYTDFFVTNDKRAIKKANTAYNFFDLKTRAITYNDFLDIVPN